MDGAGRGGRADRGVECVVAVVWANEWNGMACGAKGEGEGKGTGKGWDKGGGWWGVDENGRVVCVAFERLWLGWVRCVLFFLGSLVVLLFFRRGKRDVVLFVGSGLKKREGKPLDKNTVAC